MPDKETARWRATERSFIGHSLVEENGEVNYNPPEGSQVAANLWPLNEAAKAHISAQTDPHPAKVKAADPAPAKAAEKALTKAEQKAAEKAAKEAAEAAEKAAQGGAGGDGTSGDGDDGDVA